MYSLVLLENEKQIILRIVRTERLNEFVAECITERREKLLGVYTTSEVMDILLERLAKEGRR